VQMHLPLRYTLWCVNGVSYREGRACLCISVELGLGGLLVSGQFPLYLDTHAMQCLEMTYPAGKGVCKIHTVHHTSAISEGGVRMRIICRVSQ
jgi:hypothetical protein